jgi:hypothetical protein
VRDIVFAAGSGQEAVVTDAVEALGQNVKQEAANEFVRTECHGALAIGTVAAIAKRLPGASAGLPWCPDRGRRRLTLRQRRYACCTFPCASRFLCTAASISSATWAWSIAFFASALMSGGMSGFARIRRALLQLRSSFRLSMLICQVLKRPACIVGAVVGRFNAKGIKRRDGRRRLNCAEALPVLLDAEKRLWGAPFAGSFLSGGQILSRFRIAGVRSAWSSEFPPAYEGREYGQETDQRQFLPRTIRLSSLPSA